MRIAVRVPSLDQLRRYLDSGGTDEEVVQRLYENSLGEAGVRIARSLEEHARAIAQEDRRGLRGFEARLRHRWREGLDLFQAILVHARDVGAEFNDAHRPVAATEGDFRFDALTHLHARACLTAREVLVLLRAGYPSGAFGRWRTLHEISVVSYLIAEGGSSIAERFLLHSAIESAKDATFFQEHSEALGYEPLPTSQLQELEATRKTLLDRFGREFAKENGWASLLFPGRSRFTFRDLEEKSGLGHLRPWYRFTSHQTHGGSKGTALNVVERAGGRTLLTGPTNAGLADVGHGALLSLVQVTITLLLGGRPLRGAEDFERVANAAALLHTCERAGDAFLAAHLRLEADEEEAQSRG